MYAVFDHLVQHTVNQLLALYSACFGKSIRDNDNAKMAFPTWIRARMSCM